MEEKKEYCLRCDHEEDSNNRENSLITVLRYDQEVFTVCMQCIRFFLDKLTELYPEENN